MEDSWVQASDAQPQLEDLARGLARIETAVNSILATVQSFARDSQEGSVNPSASAADHEPPCRTTRPYVSRTTVDFGGSNQYNYVSRSTADFDGDFQDNHDSRNALDCAITSLDNPGLPRLPVVAEEVLPRNFTGLVRFPTALSNASTGGSRTSKRSARVSLRSAAWHIPLHPNSWPRVTFDFLSIFVLLYDSVMVPIIFAWDLELEGIILVLSWCFIVYWTVDMMLTAVTSFKVEGEIVTDVKTTVARYFRTWFLPDFITVSCDLVGIVFEMASASSADSRQQTVILRLIRFSKMGRFVRIGAKFHAGLYSRVDRLLVVLANKLGVAERVHFALTFVKLFCLILWLNHLGCCLWYYIGKNAPRDTGASWHAMLEQNDLIDYSSSIRMYLTGLYWSVSLMFSGSSFLTPSSTSEVLFTQLYIILSALFVSLLTSSLAAMLIRAQMVMQEQNEKLWMLSQYLAQNQIEPLLCLAIRGEVSSAMKAQKRISEGDVPCLSLLSRSLMLELRTEMYSAALLRGPLLRMINGLDTTVLAHLCYNATKNKVFERGDEEITPGAPVDQAFVVLHGALTWARSDSVVELDPERWVCEHALWVQWTAMGSVQASTGGELLAIGADATGSVLVSYPQLMQFVRAYCAGLCSAMNSLDFAGSQTDVEIGIDPDSIVASMPVELREDLSTHLLQVLHQQQQHHALSRLFQKASKDSQELEDEVRHGKCHLTVDPSGAVMRVVQLALVRLQRADGLMCVKLGTWRSGHCKTHWALPGRKAEAGGGLDGALQRFLAEDFKFFQPGIQIRYQTVDAKQECSESFGVQTKYIEVIYHATLDDDQSYHHGHLRPLGFLNESHSSKYVRSSSRISTSSSHSVSSNARRDRAYSFMDGWEVFALKSKHGHRVIYAWMPETDFYMSEWDTHEFAAIKSRVDTWLQGLSTNDIDVATLEDRTVFC